MDKKLVVGVLIGLVLVVFLGFSVFGNGSETAVSEPSQEEKPAAAAAAGTENKDTVKEAGLAENTNGEVQTVPVGSYLPSPYPWEVFFSVNAKSGAPVLVIDGGTVVRDGDGYKQPSVLAPSIDWKAQIHIEDGVLLAVVEDPKGNKQLFRFKPEQ